MPTTRTILTGLLVAFSFTVTGSPLFAADDDLATVLNRVAGEADVEILFSPDVVAEKHPGSMETEGSPEVVLERVLEGTGLTAEQTSPNVYVVRNTQTDERQPRTTAVEDTSAGGARETETTGIGSIEGRVVDSLSGTGLAGAVVRIAGTDISTTTDQRGFFRFGAVASGRLDVEVEYIGADAQSKPVMLFANQTVVADFTMNLGERDTIYVYGNRSSFLQALNQQRNAENNKTVVSADLLGTFPAETVAEALRRVPGVTFTRDLDTGEGNKVSVRGITSEGINLQVNGIQLQGTGIERAVDLTGFLADNISQITIQKSLLPEFEATGNGGLIEIETKSALDYGERHLSFGVEREFSGIDEFGDETQYNGSGVIQLSDTFAVGLNAQFRTTERSNVNTDYSSIVAPVLPDGFTSLFFLPFTFNYPFDPGLDERLVTNANYLFRDVESDNTNGSVFAAWDIGDSTRLRAEYTRIETDGVFRVQRSTNQALTGALTMPIPELGGEERRRSYIRALRPTNGINETDQTTTTDVLSLRGESAFNRWTFTYDLGYTRSENESLEYSINTLSDQNTDVFNLFDSNSYIVNPDGNGVDRIVGGAFNSVGDRIPAIALSNAGRSFLLNPDTYYIASAIERQRSNETENASLRFKAQYDFAGERLRNVKFGVQYNDVERLNSDDVLSNANIPTARSFSRLAATRQFLSDFSGNPFFVRNLGLIGAGDTSAAFLRAGTARSLFEQVAAFEAANPGSYRVTDNLVSPEESAGAISSAKTTEETLATFIQSEINLGNFTMTGGVRVELVDYVGSAISSPSVRTDAGVAIDRSVLVDAGYVQVFDNTGSTEKFLPSLVATWRPSEQWVGRFAYNRTVFNPPISAINRPQQFFIDLRPTQNRATIREGNPDLEQTVNDNFELGMEYYFVDRPAYVKAAVFYKDIKDNITNVSLADQPADIEARVREFLTPLEADSPGLLAGLNADTEYLLQRPENGDGGEIYGMEFEGAINLDFFPDSWPDFLENIQLLANVTWTDAEFPTLVSARNEDGDLFQLELDRPLAEQSEWARNFSIAYESGGFSGRLLYTYQSERVTTYDEFNLNTIVPDVETLDLISTYNFEWNGARYTLFLEADNLLNDRQDGNVFRGTGSFGGEGSPDFFFPNSLLFDGGRTFTFGIKASF